MMGILFLKMNEMLSLPWPLLVLKKESMILKRKRNEFLRKRNTGKIRITRSFSVLCMKPSRRSLKEHDTRRLGNMNEYRFYQMVKLMLNGWHCKNKKAKSDFFPSDEPLWYHPKTHPKL